MRRELGTDEIPVLVDDNAALHCGEDDAIAWLEDRFGEGEHEDGHRRKFREHEVEARR
jgi:hypothetical protein